MQALLHGSGSTWGVGLRHKVCQDKGGVEAQGWG